MSYGLAIAGDARVDMLGLDPWLQEEVIDELEMLLANPTVLPSSVQVGDITYVLNRATDDQVHYVFLSLSKNDESQKLTLLGLTYRSLPR